MDTSMNNQGMPAQNNMSAPQGGTPTPPPIQERPTMSAPESTSGTGAIVGAIIVVIILVVGGLYFWGKQLSTDTDTTDPQLEALQNTSASDEVADIEADISTTELDNLDAELGDIEAELNF